MMATIIKNEKGFALTEMLVAIIFVSLSGMLISTGIVTGTRSLSDISYYSTADILLDDYVSSIEHSLSEGRYVGEYNNAPVFENKTLGYTGYYENINGEIVFKILKIDYFGNYLSGDNRISIVPKRVLYNKEGEKAIYSMRIDYTYNENDEYEVKISVCEDERTVATRNLVIKEKREIINS